MPVGPFLRHALRASSRRSATYYSRVWAVALLLAVLGGSELAWSWFGWDRTTRAGMSDFAQRTFVVLIAMEVVAIWILVPGEVAPAIAAERQRKTLDGLLCSRLSAAEIVLGTSAAGLVKPVSRLVAILPLVFLMIPLRGVETSLVLLSYLGLVSTTLFLAALAAAVSTFARDKRGVVGWAILAAAVWMLMPLGLLNLLPRMWPHVARWVSPIAVHLFDSGPLAVLLSPTGVIGRGGPMVALPRMIGLQLAGTLVLFSSAIARLRPSCRAASDKASRSGRAPQSRRSPWPPCAEDPVLWRAMNTRPAAGPIARTVGALLSLALGLCLLVGTYWFAKPAFQELTTLGYRPAPGGYRFLEVSPFAMAISRGTSQAPPPGMGRMEFNAALRQFTLLWEFLYVLTLTGIAVEGISSERIQDTWTSLLTAPLTGKQILRAKMLGAVWRVRWGAAVLVGVWTVGVLAGAVHPLGYLTAMVGLAVSTWFLVALGTYHSLWAGDSQAAASRTNRLVMVLLFGPLLLLILPRARATILLAIGSMPLQSYLSLVSFEDVRFALRRDAYPALYAIHLNSGARATWVLATCLIGLIGQCLAAAWLTRAMFRGFDAAVGRPTGLGAFNHRDTG